mmetsp:Transcript_6396/g.11657  ORF Transcript_6396/g.11657 Transcript_6396/m.11657 type:complete len:586 (+) Transcript_6396:70-1827(+)
MSRRSEVHQSPFGDLEEKNGTSEAEFNPFGLDGGDIEQPSAEAEAAGQAETIRVASYGLTRPPQVVYQEMSPFDDKTGLAVAAIVDDSTKDGILLPPAFEYGGPDSKPSIIRNRRFRFYAALTISILIALVLSAIAIAMTHKNGESKEHTQASVTLLEKRYRDQFVAEVGEKVNIAGSPYDRAAKWIIKEDPFSLSPDAINLIQRYHLVLFYYLTTKNGKESWNSCNPPGANETDTCVYQDIEFTDTFVEYTIYRNVSDSVRWMSGMHECDWTGVFCDEADNLIAIQVSGQNCTGGLPTEIAQLPYLQAIALYHNEFTGTLPQVYAEMKQLVSLELHYNGLTGQIPDSYWRADSLQHLNLGANLLSGSISSRIGMLSQMKGLYLFDNKLSGTIPSELGQLEFMSYLHLNRNDLFNDIPTELGKLTLLRELWLWENGLDGTIPSELGLMSDMENMEIYENELTGTIPDEIYSLTHMISFDVNWCRLTGTLSTRIGQLTRMERFRVSTNDLTGTIPSEVASLRSIVLFWFHKTRFTGIVPTSLCSLRPDPLVILQADCNPSGNPAVECLCCSHCCDRLSGICLSTDI